MRVLQIGKYYYPHLGGIETVVRDLAEGLVHQGHQSTVLCYSEGRQGSIEEINGVQVERMGQFGVVASQPLSPSYFLRLREIVNSYDLVHLHAPNPLAELVLSLSELKVPLVVTYHCDVVRQKLLLPFYRPMLRHVLKKAGGIVAATKYHVEYSHTLKYFSDRCHIIPFGIKEEPFLLTESGQRQLVEVKQQYGKYLLFVGRLVPYKGLHILLEAMEHIEDKLLIIGSGPERAALEGYAQQLGVAGKVQFLGRIESRDKFAALMNGSELLVLPSLDKSEAFGMSMVEAMACGKPVVSTSLDSGVRFVNADGETGLQVPPNNSKLLAHAMGTLLSDDLMRTKMGHAARKRFEELFRLDVMLNSYFRLYESLADTQVKEKAS